MPVVRPPCFPSDTAFSRPVCPVHRMTLCLRGASTVSPVIPPSRCPCCESPVGAAFQPPHSPVHWIALCPQVRAQPPAIPHVPHCPAILLRARATCSCRAYNCPRRTTSPRPDRRTAPPCSLRCRPPDGTAFTAVRFPRGVAIPVPPCVPRRSFARTASPRCGRVVVVGCRP